MPRCLRKAGDPGGQILGYGPAKQPVYHAGHASYARTRSVLEGGHDAISEMGHAARAVRAAYPKMSVGDHLHASELHDTHAGIGAPRAYGKFVAMAHASAAMSMQREGRKSRETGDLAKSDLDGPIPTYDPNRDPNGTDVSKLSAYQGAMAKDNGLADLIVAVAQSQASCAKPDPSDYYREPVYTPGRVNG